MNTKGVEDGMSDEQAVRQVHPDAYAEQVGSDTVEILVCIGETPGRITSSITAAAWADALSKLPKPAVPVEERTADGQPRSTERIKGRVDALRVAVNYQRNNEEPQSYEGSIWSNAVTGLITELNQLAETEVKLAPIPEERTAEMADHIKDMRRVAEAGYSLQPKAVLKLLDHIEGKGK